MENKFILSCESTVDLPYQYVCDRKIPVLFYTYTVNGVEYEDDMGKNPDSLKIFYELLDQGYLPSTSQINVFKYERFFEELVEEYEGEILHIAFGSGMTPSVNNAYEAAEKVMKNHPGRKIRVVDSLGSCTGYGLLVDDAADLRDGGKTAEEVEKWALSVRNTIHHQFFATDLKLFRRGGRVSGPAAAVATVLNICPIMHLNSEGRIIAYGKVRGKKNSIIKTVDEVEKNIRNGRDYDGKMFVSHSNCIELANATIEELEKRFPKLKGKIVLGSIGTTIASHTGVGTVAVFFYGCERQK